MYLVPATLVLSGLHVTVKTIEKDQDTAPGTIISLNPPISIASIQPIISLNLPVSIAIINATPIIKPYYHLVTPVSSISSTILCYNTLCYNRSHLSLPSLITPSSFTSDLLYPFYVQTGAIRACVSTFIDTLLRSTQKTILEPIMAVEVDVPSSFLGDVLSDITGKLNLVSSFCLSLFV